MADSIVALLFHQQKGHGPAALDDFPVLEIDPVLDRPGHERHAAVSAGADLGFTLWNASNSAINNLQGPGTAIVDGGYASIFALTVDALWRFGQPDHFGGYVGLGIGGYRRYAALTNEVLVPGYICDPYWGYCYNAVTTGYQVVADDTLTKLGANASVGILFPVGSGEMYGLRTDKTTAPELRAAVTPRVKADKPIGEWNRFEITHRNGTVTVVLNGQTVIAGAKIPGLPATGLIGLQHHGGKNAQGEWNSPPALLQWRNIFIKELKE